MPRWIVTPRKRSAPAIGGVKLPTDPDWVGKSGLSSSSAGSFPSVNQDANNYGRENVQELLKEMAGEMATEMAKEMATEMAKEMAEEMAKDMAKEMVEEKFEEVKEELSIFINSEIKYSGKRLARLKDIGEMMKKLD